jgi:hypothetical protein
LICSSSRRLRTETWYTLTNCSSSRRQRTDTCYTVTYCSSSTRYRRILLQMRLLPRRVSALLLLRLLRQP